MKIGGGVGSGGGGVRVGGCTGWGDQGGCEQRIEVFVNIKKKKIGGGGEVGLGGRGQGGCDQRIEAFGKIHKKKNLGEGGGGSGWM